MTGRDLAWRIEETCFNGFPSLRQVLYHGWLLRFSEGLSRRANSANPLGPACSDAATAIETAEPLYHAQGLPAIVRVPSIADPALDRELAARGYAGEGDSLVLRGGIDGIAAAADPAVRLLSRPEPAWLAAMAALQGHTPAQADIYRRIVGAITIPARFALLSVDGEPAALAYGAVHGGLLCYESMIVDLRHRRQGLARRVIAGLALWARDSGATDACLQVEASNAPARALYAGFGLAECHRYHYRREPSCT